MKPGLIFPVTFLLLFTWSIRLDAGKRFTSLDELKKEIVNMLKNRDLSFLEKDMQKVSLDFLINARNELVVLDVYGDSISACEYVKEILNYKRVKYKQAKQLTRYMISICLVKNRDCRLSRQEK